LIAGAHPGAANGYWRGGLKLRKSGGF
jgi:hypothetical protein